MFSIWLDINLNITKNVSCKEKRKILDKYGSMHVKKSYMHIFSWNSIRKFSKACFVKVYIKWWFMLHPIKDIIVMIVEAIYIPCDEVYRNYPVCLSGIVSCKSYSSWADESILMKLYTVAVYNLRMCMKEDNPGPYYFKVPGRL